MENKDQKEDILFRYFAGELNEKEEKELLQWLNDNPSNQESASQMSDWWATVHMPRYNMDMKPDFDKHFGHLRQNNTTEKKQTTFNRHFWKNWVAAVSIGILLCSFSYFAGRSFHKHEVVQSTSGKLLFSEITTPPGALTDIVLPDGSHVWLNAGSTLKYSNEYSISKREVYLTGEACFEVTSDINNPFIVNSNDLTIHVTGTRFNVKAYADENETEVALITGCVHIHVNDTEQITENLILTSNQQLSFNKETRLTRIDNINGADAIAWIDGQIKFINQPFAQIARGLERTFNVPIQIESEMLKSENFTGSFSKTHSLEQILSEIDVDKKYNYSKWQDKIIIKDK